MIPSACTTPSYQNYLAYNLIIILLGTFSNIQILKNLLKDIFIFINLFSFYYFQVILQIHLEIL